MYAQFYTDQDKEEIRDQLKHEICILWQGFKGDVKDREKSKSRCVLRGTNKQNLKK
jgi:hypothetical protein